MPRQRFGQHFLQSSHILERIAIAACGDHAETVIEIGPGHGALTEHLLPRANRLITVEIDPDLAASLRARFAADSRLTVVEGDALAQDFAAWSPDILCGNLPYYCATPILERAAKFGIRTVALIQNEVAERLTAKPGSRSYGFLTCEIALFARARKLFLVKPGAFRPPPKVDSAVISLDPQPRAVELGVEAEPFLVFLSQCFRQKRKTLRNNLSEAHSLEPIGSLEVLSHRAEQCSLEQLANLFRVLIRT